MVFRRTQGSAVEVPKSFVCSVSVIVKNPDGTEPDCGTCREVVDFVAEFLSRSSEDLLKHPIPIGQHDYSAELAEGNWSKVTLSA